MGGTQDKRQQPGKGREEQERMRRSGQDPVHPGTSQGERGMSPEELKRRQEEMKRERDEESMRDEEI